MTMQILEIVLYNQNGGKRALSLSLGKVNIITGSSATGKSAIIDIVDYCLGSSDCAVPEGVIRETVSWYGLRMQLNSSQMFIARANPDSDRSSTNKVFVEQGTEVRSPDKPPAEANTTIQAVVTDLARKIGIAPNLNVPPPDQTRDSLEATFRHALLYCFQQQDEIAQKSTLFHNQSNSWIAQSIKDTLPYLLGAIREDHLVLQQDLTRAKRDLRRAEMTLREAEQVKGEGVSRGKILLEEAVDVGILEASGIPQEINKVMEILKKIRIWTPKEITFPASNRLVQLQDEQNYLIVELNDKSEQIKAAKTFANEAKGFENESNQQKLRLESIGLFEDIDKNKNCPACSGKFKDTNPTVEAMRQSIKQIDKNLESVARERPRLREYIERLEKKSAEINQKLEEKREAIDSIMEEQGKAKRLRDVNLRRAEIVGRISFWLDNVKIIDESSHLKDEAYEAKQKVTNLENLLDKDEKEDRMASILNIIGRQMSSWSEQLRLEHSGNPVRLDLTNATVVVDREDKPIPLKKMGSGQNWVGYHLITHFALHKYFTERGRPIPRFIFLDQPSQVYYPRDKDSEFEGSVEGLSDDDKDSLFRMYKFIFEFVENLAPNFQVIVMDHADLADETFKSSVVERWREGKALIPQDWIRQK